MGKRSSIINLLIMFVPVILGILAAIIVPLILNR
jgi:hypothetical protein